MLPTDSLTDDTLVRRSPRVAARIFNGQALVVVTDAQRLFSFNGVGTRVWELADGRSLAQIAESISGEFDVDGARARDDIRAFIAMLFAAGAIQLEPGAGRT